MALLGIGTFTQVKSISDALTMSFSIPRYITAILLTIAVAFITIGGIKRIASVAENYSIYVRFIHWRGCFNTCVTYYNITSTIALIIKSAFRPQAVFGGGTGITMVIAMQKGISRGIFSNESGLGSAPIACCAR